MATAPKTTQSLENAIDSRPLIRLKQIALDIRRALDLQDWELVAHASTLLPSALDDCSVIPSEAFQNNARLAEMAREAFTLLNTCDTEMEERMEHITHDLRRLRMGQRRSQWVKAPGVVSEGRRLDTTR